LEHIRDENPGSKPAWADSRLRVGRFYPVQAAFLRSFRHASDAAKSSALKSSKFFQPWIGTFFQQQLDQIRLAV
jgi:hypothetical protein